MSLKFSDFKNKHKGDPFIILGTGPSITKEAIQEITWIPGVKLIGVNTIVGSLWDLRIPLFGYYKGRNLDEDCYVDFPNPVPFKSGINYDLCGTRPAELNYLVVVDPPYHAAFRKTHNNFDFIKYAPADTLFVPDNYPQDVFHDPGRECRFHLGKQGGVTVDEDHIDYSITTPYLTCLLAAYMGAGDIGILGVDLTMEGNMGSIGAVKTMNNHFGRLCTHLYETSGVLMRNFSDIGKLDIPRMSIRAFSDLSRLK